MNAVGIDVSRNKSMVTVARPFGQIVVKPFEVRHTAIELKKLANFLKSLDGETKVVMEHTGGIMSLLRNASMNPACSSARSTRC